MTAHVTGRPRQHSKLQDTGNSRLGAHIRISSGCRAIVRRNLFEGCSILLTRQEQLVQDQKTNHTQGIYQLARTAIALELPSQEDECNPDVPTAKQSQPLWFG